MALGKSFAFSLFALFGGVLLSSHGQAAPLIDDRVITVHSAREIAAKRRALIQYLWGAEGFPEKRLPNVVTNIASPVKQLTNVARVDELRINMAPGLEG
jgi:hypothetical protein